MRVALVHDWLTGMRGGERVLEALVGLFPEATVHTLVHLPGSVSPAIEARPVRTSFIQRLPGAPARFRQYLPLFPLAVARLDLGTPDLVLATSHCVAIGARAPGAPHAAYCFTPMRYAWGFEAEYLGRLPAGARFAVRVGLSWLRRWDRTAGRRVAHLACISRHVAARIRETWAREARVIYPPVRTDFFRPAPGGPPADAEFLCVSALAPYKRLDVAVDAFTRLGWPLAVIGTGPEAARLRRRAGPSVRFLGWQDDEAVRRALARCRAFVFPGEEEFGIAPLEAMAAGRPVVAYRRGALVETSAEGVTGLFFDEQIPDALVAALRRFARETWDPARIRAHALGFGEGPFRDAMQAFVAGARGAPRELQPAC
jgi:glycosyltransferase involved in cell wall biosynthesis